MAPTWTLKVCRLMAFWAVLSGLVPFFLHTLGVQVVWYSIEWYGITVTSYGLLFRITKIWTPNICRIIAFRATFGGFGPLFYILLGSR